MDRDLAILKMASGVMTGTRRVPPLVKQKGNFGRKTAEKRKVGTFNLRLREK